jgi:hypothetical protein
MRTADIERFVVGLVTYIAITAGTLYAVYEYLFSYL